MLCFNLRVTVYNLQGINLMSVIRTNCYVIVMNMDA
jgi:hypothetical protein